MMMPGAASMGGGGGGAMAGLTGGTPTPPLPVPLPDWLAGNELFKGGLGLLGAGAAMGLLRGGASSLEAVCRRQLLMTLEVPSKDFAYQWVMQWLVAKGVHGSRHLGVETTYAKDVAGRQTASFDFVPSPGRHWVRYKGSFVRIERKRETQTVAMQTGIPFETLTLTTLAWRPTLFHELLTEAKETAISREEGKTVIYQVFGHEWRPFGTPKRIRPFNSVILDSGVANEILHDVNDFMLNQSWYLDRGIPYRRGYLLHGPPGCGKSSYVAALAGQLGYNIAVLNLGEPTMTDDRLQHLLATSPPRTLVLLEDVDFAVGDSQPADASGPYAGLMRVSFSGLLNALDGVVATEERIIFMTTNHFKRLPRALVRPGRVDLNVYVGLASRAQLHQMFVRFFPGQEALAEQFASLCDGEQLSMAELQGFFMFFKGQPEACSANVGPYLEARRQAHAEQGAIPHPSPPRQEAAGGTAEGVPSADTVDAPADGAANCAMRDVPQSGEGGSSTVAAAGPSASP
eukprot:TRINITY_DN36014_c0_g1_i1.p1 TRINITY_DN36014_c0_g1~~TRINITY_DN36014_c0_g1_i1.p1  ORF type:complete len:515 (-),score=93.41 TRINITY_DN36014_c0_g1_i1:76-1620(-)